MITDKGLVRRKLAECTDLARLLYVEINKLHFTKSLNLTSMHTQTLNLAEKRLLSPYKNLL